ncbi:MAG TPA: helix-turn-helix domain-containing protein [Thermoanaerobaculia bacterium]|nr:helix-turn-helix domain-containing protein [Thermoanaerobaculia bacterium]
MSRPIPPPLSVALTTLRRRRGLKEGDLAALSGISKRMISRYELGTDVPSREKVDELAAAMDYEPEDVEWVLFGILQGTTRPQPGPLSPVDPTPAERRRIREVAGRVTRAELALIDAHFCKHLRAFRARRDRSRADDLVRLLLEEPDSQARSDLVESSAQFHQWAVSERLCHESAKTAAGSAEKAQELAALALRAAELSPGEPLWLQRLTGYVWLFVANGRRVGGDMPAAGQGFALARELFEAGAAADPGLLAAWRLPDLEASWRRSQGEFDRALELHEKALALAPPEARGRILLKKAGTLEQMGEPELALATLEEAEPLIDGQREPQSLFGLYFNRAVNLCHLGKFPEAEALLGPIGDMALVLGHELNRFRLLWLRGRLDAGLGREQEAEAAFQQVRQAFRRRNIAFDFAKVTLELAVLYRSQGRLAEVKALAKQTLWIFEAQRVHKEAEKALRLFCEAAEAERLTVELARRILRYLERAQHNPRLRFEE